MSKDIESREKAIFLLQKADETIQKNYIDCETLPPELFNNISKTVTDLRIYSINVVTHMNRVREICSYSAISGKYNFDKLNETYLFESNYLIKMKSDLDFLSEAEQHKDGYGFYLKLHLIFSLTLLNLEILSL